MDQEKIRIFVGADLNGHVEEGNTANERVMGRHGVGVRNVKGGRVINFVGEL